MTLRTAIIGAGKVADTHAQALVELAESEFVAVCNHNIDRAEALAATYQVQAYSSVEAMLAEADLDAVSVCTPHPAHAEAVLKAVEAGVHVIVEKPLASSLADCDAMINAAEANNVKLAVISQRRLYEPVQRIRRAIDDGKLGRPILGTVHMFGWRDQAYYESDAWRGTWQGEGGGVLVNQAPHQLDILQWYMGPVAELYGQWDNFNHPYIEVEDTAAAILRFESGALGIILLSNSQNPALYGKVAVYGSNGASVSVQTDGGAMFIAGMSTIEEPPINDVWTIPGEEEMVDTWKQQDTALFEQIDATKYYHKLQLRDFLQAIVEDRDPMVTGVEGRKTVEIFTAIYRSQRDRCPITFPLKPEYDRMDFDGRFGGQRTN